MSKRRRLTPAQLAAIHAKGYQGAGGHPDSHIIRQNIIGEHQAVVKYEDDASVAKSPRVAAILKDIANEEKVHIGELHALLNQEDAEQAHSMFVGSAEVGKKKKGGH